MGGRHAVSASSITSLPTGETTSASWVPCVLTASWLTKTFDGAVNGPKFIDFVRWLLGWGDLGRH